MAEYYRPNYTTGNPLEYFRRRPDGSFDVTVVGNGPISEDDRVRINGSSNVVRFNDMNNWRLGEPTSLRVQRFPQRAKPKRACNASVWAVSASPHSMPNSSKLYTWVYEWQFTHGALVRPGFFLWPTAQVLEPWSNLVRIFENCTWCGIKCYANQTASGPSTGGLVLSELQAIPQIATIEVFGMNWGGDVGHIDFKYPDIVPRCCTKCRFYKTLTDNYGDSGMHYTKETNSLVVTASTTGGVLIAAKIGLVAVTLFHGGKHVHRKIKERQATVTAADAKEKALSNTPNTPQDGLSDSSQSLPLLAVPVKGA